MHKFVLRLPIELYKEIEKLAVSDTRSVNIMINLLLKKAIEDKKEGG